MPAAPPWPSGWWALRLPSAARTRTPTRPSSAWTASSTSATARPSGSSSTPSRPRPSPSSPGRSRSAARWPRTSATPCCWPASCTPSWRTPSGPTTASSAPPPTTPSWAAASSTLRGRASCTSREEASPCTRRGCSDRAADASTTRRGSRSRRPSRSLATPSRCSSWAPWCCGSDGLVSTLVPPCCWMSRMSARSPRTQQFPPPWPVLPAASQPSSPICGSRNAGPESRPSPSPCA
mmetsp:Transcript_18336/g.52328  ORF Transcript_18336/g.52328 Transcript_18336/m.52328 type:complete len:236 (-) Transcript_18336:2077-2784(-)